MKKYLITYLILFVSFLATSQTILLQFDLSDETMELSEDSLQLKIYSSYADVENIFYKGKYINQRVVSIDLGDIDDLGFDQLKIQFKSESYYTLNTSISIKKFRKQIKKGENIKLSYLLKYKGQTEDVVDILAYYKPNIVYSSEQLNVSDFVVVHPDTVILLTYPKRLNLASELLYYVKDSVINRREVPGVAEKFIKDYRNRIFLRCKEQDYILQDGEFLTLRKVDRKQLNQYIQPIVDTLSDEGLFFSNYNELIPSYDYFKIDMTDTTESLLHHIEDKEMMEHYRAEYKWADVRTKLWAWEMEDETGIDRQTWVGASVFTNSIYYEAPYGNLFIVDDKAYVFDYYENYIYQYDGLTGEKLDSIAITFHLKPRRTGWKKTLIQDPISKKIYTYFDDAGFTDMYEIDLETGKILNKFTLFYRYVENLQMFNDKAYYIYRPFESIQKKFLYIEDVTDFNRDLTLQKRFKK